VFYFIYNSSIFIKSAPHASIAKWNPDTKKRPARPQRQDATDAARMNCGQQNSG
jgi:hypothetical protein